MRKKISDLIKFSYENKLILNNKGVISGKKENQKFFYTSGKNIYNSKSHINLHKVYVNSEYYEINNMTQNETSPNIDFHAKLFIKNFNKDTLILETPFNKNINLKEYKTNTIKQDNYVVFLSHNLDDCYKYLKLLKIYKY